MYYSTKTDQYVIMYSTCPRLCHLSRDYGLSKGGHLEWGPTTNLGFTRAYGAYLMSERICQDVYGCSTNSTTETFKSD